MAGKTFIVQVYHYNTHYIIIITSVNDDRVLVMLVCIHVAIYIEMELN